MAFAEKDLVLDFGRFGFRQIRMNMDALARNMPKEAGRVLLDEGNLIMTDAKENYVPSAIDGGELRASGKVEMPVIGGRDSSGRFTAAGFGGGASVRLVFGGRSAPYATAVHEHISAASPPSWKNVPAPDKDGKGGLNFHLGRARHKYLELPMRRAFPKIIARMARNFDMNKMMGG